MKGTTMTNAQEKVISRLKTALLNKASLSGRVEVEVKSENIDHREDSGVVFFSIEVGNKGDEGSMLEVFGRDRRLFMIGKRGGVSLMMVTEGLSVHSFNYKQVTGFHNSIAYFPAK
jgi:hypothetical protein